MNPVTSPDRETSAVALALPWLGIYPLTGPFWTQLHYRTADITLVLVPVHVALRWRWIAGVGRRLLSRRPVRRPG